MDLKMWYLYTMEFYSATKKNEILSFAKWMALENIILREDSQVQKDNSCMFSLICGRQIQYKHRYYHIYIEIYSEHVSKSRTNRGD
jgi:hypothetical protein